MPRPVAVILLAIAMGGCPGGPVRGPAPLRAPVAPDWRTLVGCYRVESRSFVLDTIPVVTGWRGRESARQARSLPVDPQTGRRFWLVTPHNILEVVFEDGLWATRLELVVQGDSLVGRPHTYGDQPHVPPSVEPATGVREPCPADAAAAAPGPAGADHRAGAGFPAVKRAGSLWMAGPQRARRE